MFPWYISNLLGKICCSPNNNQPFCTIEIKKKISWSVTVFEKPPFSVLCGPSVYRSTSGNYDCYRRINISYWLLFYRKRRVMTMRLQHNHRVVRKIIRRINNPFSPCLHQPWANRLLPSMRIQIWTGVLKELFTQLVLQVLKILMHVTQLVTIFLIQF